MGGSDHSPGNGDAGVSAGDNAVLLLRVDHGGVNGQRGTGVHYGARSVGNREDVDEDSVVKVLISIFPAFPIFWGTCQFAS